MESILRETRLGDVGVTYYAVAAGLVRIIEAILRDENTILTVSTLAAHYGISEVCVSLPTKVNCKGADQILHLPLNQEELSGLFKSAESVKAAISALNLGTNCAQVAELRAKLN
jgi:L-lactate dehydrogenase